ncbi:MAG: lytic murein transglycosylase [Aestuariivirgaceae bacterium]
MIRGLIAIVAFLCFGAAAAAWDLPSATQMTQYKQRVAAAAAKEGLERSFVLKVIGDLEADPDIPGFLVSQPEAQTTIAAYVKNLVAESRVAQGRKLEERHAALLQTLERRYGVDPEIILAIYGVESNFGTRQGKRNVLRSLLTLAAMGYREEFFRQELIACLKIIAQKEANPELMKGSWAGAMGSTQFMPTSYLKFSVDHDRDGLHDIWTNVPDSLASIANFLKAHGWQAGHQWGAEVILPEGFRFGTGFQPGARWSSAGVRRRDGQPIPPADDFYLLLLSGARGPAFLVSANYQVLKEYNHSDLYAISIGLIANRIASGDTAMPAWPPSAKPLNKAQRLELLKRLRARGYQIPEKEARIDLEEREVIRQAQKSLGMTMDGNPSEELLRRMRGSE